MWVLLRAAFGIFLVCLILVIVISPYVDLPQTTLRARQAAAQILTVLGLCWACAAGWQQPRRTERLTLRKVDLFGYNHRNLVELTCAFLC